MITVLNKNCGDHDVFTISPVAVGMVDVINQFLPYIRWLEMLRKQGREVRWRRHLCPGVEIIPNSSPRCSIPRPFAATPFPWIVVTESSNYFYDKCVQSFVIALRCLLCPSRFISGNRITRSISWRTPTSGQPARPQFRLRRLRKLRFCGRRTNDSERTPRKVQFRTLTCRTTR